MTDIERERAIQALRNRRAARGASDPLNVLHRYISNAITNGATPVEEISK